MTSRQNRELAMVRYIDAKCLVARHSIDEKRFAVLRSPQLDLIPRNVQLRVHCAAQ